MTVEALPGRREPTFLPKKATAKSNLSSNREHLTRGLVMGSHGWGKKYPLMETSSGAKGNGK